jgi:hypothetical protein
MNPPSIATGHESWPELRLANWAATRDTLHMWIQIVGHVRMVLSPPVNHWWHVVLYVSSRGLTTSPIPYNAGTFEVDFDFLTHRLLIRTSRHEKVEIPLEPKPVAKFYSQFMAALHLLGIEVKIHSKPDQVPEPIPFASDTVHRDYDPEYAQRFWRVLLETDKVFKEFRGGFIGKCSPVHFFWGSFDLACSRYSGRPAPERPGADAMTREAYSHEVFSGGFWPGGTEKDAPVNDAAFYAYVVPQPEGFAKARIEPKAAFYHEKLGEFILMYEDVRSSADPRAALRQFLQTTYDAGATLGRWPREALERK